LEKQRVKDLFAKYGILSNEELESRYNTYVEAYETIIGIEATTALDIAKTMIVPAVVTAISEYAAVPAVGALTQEMSDLLEKTLDGIKVLEAAKEPSEKIAAMNGLRASVDALEAIVPADLWPMPSYSEMLLS
jgi:glutamine synthetase